MAILSARDLSVRFGGVHAVRSVNVDIEKGKLTSIIGPNGAGKTTLFNLLTGYHRPTTGRVFLDGDDITDLPIERKVRRGLTRTFQLLNVFDDLTVRKNIRVVVQRRHGRGWNLVRRHDAYAEVEQDVERVIDRVGLRAESDIVARGLSYGHRRQLEIALALASRPRVLLLDEPMSGLGMYESGRISEFIRQLSTEITIVLVEHHMSVVLDISDFILVLNRGELIASGTPAEIQENAAVQEAYLGGQRYPLQPKQAEHA